MTNTATKHDGAKGGPRRQWPEPPEPGVPYFIDDSPILEVIEAKSCRTRTEYGVGADGKEYTHVSAVLETETGRRTLEGGFDIVECARDYDALRDWMVAHPGASAQEELRACPTTHWCFGVGDGSDPETSPAIIIKTDDMKGRYIDRTPKNEDDEDDDQGD